MSLGPAYLLPQYHLCPKYGECLARALKQRQLERQLQAEITPEVSAMLHETLEEIRRQTDG